MKILKVFSVVAVLLTFLSSLWFSVKPTGEAQFVAMLLILISILLLVISSVVGIRVARRYRFRAFIPAAICLVGLPVSFMLSSFLGGSIRDWHFRKNLPRYTQVVHLIENGEIKTYNRRVNLPDQYSDLSLATFVETNNQKMSIEFITGMGFPVKHSGYLYVSTGNIDSDVLKHWHFRSRINANWFRISD
jgi:hypothetical protein